MHRPPRILLNAATLVSLVLCVATLAHWTRGRLTTPSVAEQVAAATHIMNDG